MTLDAFLKMYYALIRDVRDSTIDQYGWCVLSFSKFLGRPALLSDLRHDVVSAWIKWLCGRGSKETAKSRRMTLLSIWSAATALGYAPARSGVVRPVKVPNRVVRSLTTEQCADVMSETRKLRGRLFRCRKAPYMTTLVRATLETSMRQSDLHILEWPDVVACHGTLQLVQIKTGVRRWAFMSRELLNEIAAWHGPHGLIWPRGERGTIGKILQKIGLKLGIRLTHTRLRVAAITDVERQQAGAGWIFAGHASPATTRTWYTDFDRVADSIPRPTFFEKTITET